MKNTQKKLQQQQQPKTGLLGVYDTLTREQLIEKLLVAEEMLKKLYKENKELKEQLNQK